LLSQTAAGWSYALYPLAGLLAALALFAGWRLWAARKDVTEPRRSHAPEAIAVVLIVLATVAGFAPRAGSFEKRYLVLPAVLFAVLLAGGAVFAWRDVWVERGWPRAAGGIALALSALLWLGAVPYRDVLLWRDRTEADPERAAYLALARRVHAEFARGAPVVVGDHPYFYTLATGGPSLSVPESDDTFLRAYMERYGARVVFLTRREVEFWRPAWLRPGGLPGWLELRADLGAALVFERRSAR
jgi:hypothetical protein